MIKAISLYVSDNGIRQPSYIFDKIKKRWLYVSSKFKRLKWKTDDDFYKLYKHVIYPLLKIYGEKDEYVRKLSRLLTNVAKRIEYINRIMNLIVPLIKNGTMLLAITAV